MNPSFLRIEGLSKSFSVSLHGLFFSRQRVDALKNISFSLNNHDHVGIVGESGSGKTTLAKILAGFISADCGQVLLQDQPLLSLNRFDRADRVQMMFQDPFSSINPKLLLGAQLCEAVKRCRNMNALGEAKKLMEAVGLPVEYLQRYPHQLSGGQRQRFALARALIRRPSLLIADEPVSSLDVTVQKQIIELLNRLKIEYKFSLMIISHDLAIVSQLCNRLVVMKAGEIMEEGELHRVLVSPCSSYTQELIRATPTLD